MKKIFLVLLCSLLLAMHVYSDEISFSSDESSVRLQSGRESVILSGNAEVRTGSLVISADRISLSGAEWSTIECSGHVQVEDIERDLTIRTSIIYYDRANERLLISSYVELEDRGNEMNASANHLEFDMNNEILTLTGRVSFSKINGDDVIRGRSEMVSYDRSRNTLNLSLGCTVVYKGDEYQAEMIAIDIERDSISLSSGIRGTING